MTKFCCSSLWVVCAQTALNATTTTCAASGFKDSIATLSFHWVWFMDFGRSRNEKTRVTEALVSKVILRQNKGRPWSLSSVHHQEKTLEGVVWFQPQSNQRQTHTHRAKSILQHLGPYSQSRETMKSILCRQIFTCFRFSPKCKCYDRLIRPESTDLKKKK